MRAPARKPRSEEDVAVMGLCGLDSTCYPATSHQTRTLKVRGAKLRGRETTPALAEVETSLWFQHSHPHGHLPEAASHPSCTGPHLAHAPTTGSRQRICWRGSGIRPGRTLRRRAHVRRARQGTARLAGNRQNPAARKGFNFAEGTLPGWYNHGACVGVSHAIFQLFYKCEFS